MTSAAPSQPQLAPPGRARVMLYIVLMAIVIGLNLTLFTLGAVLGWWQPHARCLQVIAAISQVNLLLAILPRQHWMVNLISAVATRAPTSWPLRVRWRLAQYYHVGGLHIGGAISGTSWYLVYGVLLAPAWADGEPGYDDWSLGLAIAIVAVLITICVLAMPGMRTKSPRERGPSTRTWCSGRTASGR